MQAGVEEDSQGLGLPHLSGLELSRRFFEGIVAPIVDAGFPGLSYAAALIGPGSEVLGFDTEMSRDHDFGPRLFILLRDDDADLRAPLHDLLDRELPQMFGGFPVDIPSSKLSARFGFDGRTRTHRVFPLLLDDYLDMHFGEASQTPWDAVDWLTVSSQSLREFTTGVVFHDGPGELTEWRERLAWYPGDVRRYLLAAGWQRIGQEEHLWQRAATVGDELGVRVLAARLVREVMRQCFLIERVYAPYAKWLGTAFGELRCAAAMEPLLHDAMAGERQAERDSALMRAFEALARMHNALGLTKRMPERVSPFFDRPFSVIHGEAFAAALTSRITDPAVRKLARRPLIGNVDQWTDNTDVGGIERSKRRALYE